MSTTNPSLVSEEMAAIAAFKDTTEKRNSKLTLNELNYITDNNLHKKGDESGSGIIHGRFVFSEYDTIAYLVPFVVTEEMAAIDESFASIIGVNAFYDSIDQSTLDYFGIDGLDFATGPNGVFIGIGDGGMPLSTFSFEGDITPVVVGEDLEYGTIIAGFIATGDFVLTHTMPEDHT